MRAVVTIALVLVAGCRIPSETFTVRDGSVDAAPDGPLPPVGFVYVVDSMSGIYVFTRTVAGDLALAPITQPQPPTMTPVDAVANADGTKLYVLSLGSAVGAVVSDYTIEADGSLTAGGSIPFGSGPPAPRPIHLAITPNGKFLAVAVQTLNVAVIKLDAAGALVSLSNKTFETLGGTSMSVAFSAASDCLYIMSGSALVSNTFSGTGNLSGSQTIAGPANGVAIAVDPASTDIYAGGGSTAVDLHGYAAQGCGFASNTTATLAMTSAPYTLLVDSTKHRLYAPGENVVVFDIASATALNGRSGLPQAGSATTGGAALDERGTLYVSGPGYAEVASGHTAVISVGVDSSGNPVTLGTANLPVAAKPVSVVLAGTLR